MDLAAYPSALEVEPERWQRAVGQRPFASQAWYAFGAAIFRSDRPLVRLVLDREGEVGAAALWLRRLEQLPVSQPILRQLAAAIVRRFPLLTCQTPFAGLSGLYHDSFRGNRLQALARLVRSIEGEAPGLGASFVLFPYLPAEVADSPAWGRDSFGVRMPPNTYLPVLWGDFEDYLRSRGSSVRKDYRLHANRAARMGLSTRLVSELPDGNSALRLIRRVEREHRTAPNPWAEDLLRDAGKYGGKWILVEAEERLVGCGLVLKDGDHQMLTLLGLRKGVQQVYFALMYAAVRYAIETGAGGIFGGGGAYHFKERLGFARTPDSHVRVFAVNPHLAKLGRWLAMREAEDAGRVYHAPAAYALQSGSKPGSS